MTARVRVVLVVASLGYLALSIGCGDVGSADVSDEALLEAGWIVE